MIRNVLPCLTLLAACGGLPFNEPRIELSDARESVFKVNVTQRVDTSSIPAVGKPWVDVKTMGTGWIIDRTDHFTYLMTAGHVCESSRTFGVDMFDIESMEMKKLHLPIIETVHSLESRRGVKVYPVVVVADSDMDDEMHGLDLCLMVAAGDLGAPLPVASSDPSYGTISEVIGAPAGLWAGGIAPTADLKYSGRGDVFGIKDNALAFVGDVTGGNSGSPILYKGRVVALLNLSGTRFKELTTGVPHEAIRKFFKEHRPD